MLNLLLFLLFLIRVEPSFALLPSTHKTLSLAELCTSSKQLSLASYGENSAYVLSISLSDSLTARPTACELNLTAPDRHFLAISYLQSSEDGNISCPLQLSLVSLAGSRMTRKNLCKSLTTSNTPHIFTPRLMLTFSGGQWPTTKEHRLVINSVGADPNVCVQTQLFPCNWIKSENNSNWPSGLIPNLCVSRHLVCDNIVNCPLSGVDEVESLCHVETIPPEDHDSDNYFLKNLIHKKAEEAAIQLAGYHKDITEQKSDISKSQVEDINPATHSSVFVFYTVIITMTTMVILSIYKIIKPCTMRLTLSSASTPTSPSPTVQAQQDIEMQGPSNTTGPSSEEQQSPPSYSTLFPQHK